jgi:hypothetical protein
MLIAQLQQILGHIYDLPVVHDVRDYLITRRADGSLQSSAADEQLLVSESEEALELALFLDGKVLERLEQRNPLEALTQENLGDYLTAVEGVSHFVYVVWNAHFDKPVSLLELELQAEVDKFVSCAWLLDAQGDGRFPKELHHALFTQTTVAPELAGDRAGMYRTASHYAARYCRRLARQWMQRRRPLSIDLLAELRRFYRLGGGRKLTHIEAAA